MFKNIRNFFRGVKDRIKARFQELPTLSELWQERRVFADALIALGDKIEQWEPADMWILEQITTNARIVEFAARASGLGEVKAEVVQERVREAWKLLGRADDAFDAFWSRKGRVMLNNYVRGCNELSAWVPVI